MSKDHEYKISYLDTRENEWKDPSIKDGDSKVDYLEQYLLQSLQMQNVVVLAGSGTSLGIEGAPSMWKLWEYCTKHLFSYLPSVKEEYILKNPDLDYVRKSFDYFCVFTEEANEIFKKINYSEEQKAKGNIEELLSICEAYLSFQKDTKVQDFVIMCKKIILEKCSFLKDNNDLKGHRDFIHKLSRRRVRDSRLKVFTTNYDICFETAASMQGIVVIDGFSFSQPRLYDPRFFDFDIVRRNRVNEQNTNYLEGVFQLFKLHGSINWKRDEYGMIVEDITDADNVTMIFPAKGKYQQSYIQPHLELMARYLAALREPNTCLLISGFGFNDDHLSEPIISAIKTNPHLRVIIADYAANNNYVNPTNGCSDYWENLKDLSKNHDITFINASFDDFAGLIPDLQSLSPAENLELSIKQVCGAKNDN